MTRETNLRMPHGGAHANRAEFVLATCLVAALLGAQSALTALMMLAVSAALHGFNTF